MLSSDGMEDRLTDTLSSCDGGTGLIVITRDVIRKNSLWSSSVRVKFAATSGTGDGPPSVKSNRYK